MNTKKLISLISLAALLILATAVTTYAQSGAAIKPKVNELTVTGPTFISGTLNANGGINNSSGPVSINAVSGLKVTKDLDLQGKLKNSLGSPVMVSSALDAQGTIINSLDNVNIDDNLTAKHAEFYNGLNVAPSIAITDPGNLFVSGAMNVDGDAVLNANVIVSGHLESSGGVGDWQWKSGAIKSYTSGSAAVVTSTLVSCPAGYTLIHCDTAISLDTSQPASSQPVWWNTVGTGNPGSCTSNLIKPNGAYTVFQPKALCFNPAQ